MKQWIRRSLAAALLTACLAAQAATPRQVLDQLLKTQKDQAVMTCRLRREQKGALLGGSGVKVLEGRLQWKRGGKARLEVDKPSRQLMVSDGKAVWMEVPEARQVLRQDASQLRSAGQFFLDLASSIRYYSKNSHLHGLAAGKEFKADVQAFELVPRDPAKLGFDRMKVWVEKSRGQIVQVVLESEGMEIKVGFDAVKAHTLAEVAAHPSLDLPESLFRYKVPPGYEVVRSFMP